MYRSKSDGTVWTIVHTEGHNATIRRTDENGCVHMKSISVDQLYEEFDYIHGSEAAHHGRR